MEVPEHILRFRSTSGDEYPRMKRLSSRRKLFFYLEDDGVVPVERRAAQDHSPKRVGGLEQRVCPEQASKRKPCQRTVIACSVPSLDFGQQFFCQNAQEYGSLAAVESVHGLQLGFPLQATSWSQVDEPQRAPGVDPLAVDAD